MERGVFFFAADGRLLARPDETGKIHQATEDDERAVVRGPWPWQLGMWRRRVGDEANPVSGQVADAVELSNAERDLLLSALFELSITYAEDDEKRERSKALAHKLGGDPEATFFGARERDTDTAGLENLPGLDDEADGVYHPHEVEGNDEAPAELTLARLLGFRHKRSTSLRDARPSQRGHGRRLHPLPSLLAHPPLSATLGCGSKGAALHTFLARGFTPAQPLRIEQEQQYDRPASDDAAILVRVVEGTWNRRSGLG